jgi:dihydropteroate synthase
LVGLSRKSFIGKVISKTSAVVPPSERLFGTIAANTIALMHGANILRVHDTKAAFDAVQIFLATPRAASLTATMSHVSS